MKIFIAGCGRSGTTLIRDLMNCFHDTYVLKEGPYGESPFSRFTNLSRPESHLVIKRTGGCWKTLPSLPDDIGLIYCVRHPFDVMTSTHPLTKHTRRFHVTPERWKFEYDGFRALQAVQSKHCVFIMRYEDLVCNPNIIQEKISGQFGLVTDRQFTENSDRINIFTDSIDKWQRDADLFDYLQTIPRRFRTLINDFCEEFEYILPAEYALGYVATKLDLSLLFINNPNDLEALDDQPFFWLGGQATILDVYSTFSGNVRILFEALAGPSYPGHSELHLFITSGDWNMLAVIRPGPVTLKIPVSVGENQIVFEVVEQPTIPVMPNGDSRPLMLGVLNLAIER